MEALIDFLPGFDGASGGSKIHLVIQSKLRLSPRLLRCLSWPGDVWAIISQHVIWFTELLFSLSGKQSPKVMKNMQQNATGDRLTRVIDLVDDYGWNQGFLINVGDVTLGFTWSGPWSWETTTSRGKNWCGHFPKRCLKRTSKRFFGFNCIQEK